MPCGRPRSQAPPRGLGGGVGGGYDVIPLDGSQFPSLKSKDISEIFIPSGLAFLFQVLCAVVIINKDDYSDFYRSTFMTTLSYRDAAIGNVDLQCQRIFKEGICI